MKGSKWYGVLHAKCPICHEGEVFVSKKMYNLKLFDKMHAKCASCGHKFEIEQGYWIGAMYVSYALTVFFSVLTFLITYLIYPNASSALYIGLISSVVVLLAPFTYRLSRLIWMNMFSKYNPNKAKKNYE